MIIKANTCCFTGHRIEKLPWGNNENDPRCIKLKETIYDTIEAVYKSGYRHFICGMATGCDMYFCEAALKLRESHKEITVEAAIPYEEQSFKWNESLKARYNKLVEECDYYTMVQNHYSPDCLMRRNRYMVDNSALLIAAYNGRPGGTQSTMLYAMRNQVEIIEIGIDY